MDIVDTLLGLALVGAQWVLWLLIGLSVVSVAIILERTMYFLKLKLDFGRFRQDLSTYLSAGQIEKAITYCEHIPALEAQVALSGLLQREKGRMAMSDTMEGFAVGEKQKLDRGLGVLGTLASNAPFIGLLGTVIGIIKAFHDLAHNPDGGPTVVMQGIAEALVTTALGLAVAIPAAVAFNTFTRIIKKRMANAESMMKLIMTQQS